MSERMAHYVCKPGRYDLPGSSGHHFKVLFVESKAVEDCPHCKRPAVRAFVDPEDPWGEIK